MKTLSESWSRFWSASGARPAPELLGSLILAWSEPHRHYHGLQHLAECLRQLEIVWPWAEHPVELFLAIWFHDAVHQPGAHDNEARSADWASQALGEAGFAPAAIERVTTLIMATRHTTDAPASVDEALLRDIDLSILAAVPLRFAEYEAQIRAEYAHIPDQAYRAARQAFFEKMLARPTLFLSPRYQSSHEQRARRNLEHYLGSTTHADRLSAGAAA